MKKRGLGAGLWNGFGGKVEVNETVRDSAKREMKEECGIDVPSLAFVGLVKFNMTVENKTIIVHVFKTSEFSGSITESEEMAPKWFDTDSLPYDNMWPDDRIWYPDMLEDKLILGEYSFAGHSNLTSTDHRVVQEEELLQA